MRVRNKVAAFAVAAVFMLSVTACGRKDTAETGVSIGQEDVPVDTAAPAEEAPSVDVPKEAAADNVSAEETTEEETLETVFFDNLTHESHFGWITETGFCNYEIAAGGDWYKYKVKINNLEKGMVPWYLGAADADVACRMYYASNDDDVFMMTFGLIAEIDRGIGCLHPDAFRNASVGELFERRWMPYLTDRISDVSICEFVEDENTQYIYTTDASPGSHIDGRDAKFYTVLINNKDGSGAFWASIGGSGKYFNDDELLRRIKKVNMRLEGPLNDKSEGSYEKDVGNGKSDYYLYYRNNLDSSKSSELVVKGFERDKWVGFDTDGELYYAQLLSKDNIDSISLSIYFNMGADIEFVRSLNVENLPKMFGGDMVEGSFSLSESDDDYSVYYAMIRDNTLLYNRYFYNKKNKTSYLACIIPSNNETDNAEEFFEILRNIQICD